ncbi:hypothetical protein IFM89_033245 [Coptis chinensis]|uniref:RNase H type-1 domain-containing protein n=1 Tax=Coptis chinensis TaxID=261450 RepID=A0A835MJY2_9MAGN|nr:hypothetical protein IFM89_033245 [Coptis chinensis]
MSSEEAGLLLTTWITPYLPKPNQLRFSVLSSLQLTIWELGEALLFLKWFLHLEKQMRRESRSTYVRGYEEIALPFMPLLRMLKETWLKPRTLYGVHGADQKMELMLNVDGSVEDNNGYGGVIRNRQGSSTKKSILYQELMAVEKGLVGATLLGVRKLRIGSNSLIKDSQCNTRKKRNPMVLC